MPEPEQTYWKESKGMAEDPIREPLRVPSQDSPRQGRRRGPARRGRQQGHAILLQWASERPWLC